MLAHFQTLLAAIAASPTCPISQLSLWHPQQELLARLGPQQHFEVQECLHERFLYWAETTPDAIALVEGEQQISYGVLARQACQVASHLRAQGVGADVRVGLGMERGIPLLIGLLAVLLAGGAYVPLDPTYPRERLYWLMEDAELELLLVQHAVGSSFAEAVPPLVYLEDLLAEPEPAESVGAREQTLPEHLAYIIYTSGSTGRPKGVMISHAQVLRLLAGTESFYQFGPSEVWSLFHSYAFDFSVWEIWGALLYGARLLVVPYWISRSPQHFAQLVTEQGVSILNQTPSAFRQLMPELLARPERVKQGLRAVIFGGEALEPGSLRQWLEQLGEEAPKLINMYGITETTVHVTLRQLELADCQVGAGSVIGWPLADLGLYVLDSQLQLCPLGVPGELYVSGAGLARGYLHQAGLTAERFVPHPFSTRGGERLYKTGDLARYMGEKAFEYLGRNDQQVKIRGFRIELGEIETVLSQHPAVQASVVVAREDTPGDRRLVAYVVSAHNEPLAPGDLRAYLKQQLPEYMVPPVIMALDAFPVTPNGKLDRRALPVPDLTRSETPGDAVAPRNELETRIMAVWSEVLGVETLGIDDNFFDLGGESFKAVRAVRKISDSLGVMELFLHPTIRQLAESMASKREQGPRRLLQELTPPVDSRTRAISLVCIPFAGGSPIMYQPMARAMPASASLFAVEVPGHDFALRNEPLQALTVVAARCVQEIQERVPGPIALFGHCLGGALAIEMARQLEAIGRPLVGIFIAGHFPTPRLPGRLFELLHRLFPSEKWTSRHTILEFLRAMGFFTEVIDPQEQAFVVHNLQQEVSEINDYYTKIYQSPGAKLKAPIQSIMGQRDRSTELYQERYKEWEFFSASVNLATIPKAGHYFPKYQATEVAAIVTEQVAQWQQLPPPGETPGFAQTNEALERRMPATQRPRRQSATPSSLAFFTVAIGQLISLIGTGLTTFAMGVWVYQQTGSITSYAFVMVFALLPAIAVIPFGGAVADRFDRKKIMLACDSIAGVISATIAILLTTHSLQLWQVYVLACLASITVAFQQPAYLAAVTQLTPKRYYGRANGIVQFGSGAGVLLAPLMGGLLTALIGLSGIVFIDMFTFLFAVTATLLVRFPNSLWRKQEEPFLKEVGGGWRYVWKRHGLVSLVLFTTVSNYIFAITDVLVTPLILSLGNVEILGIVLAANGAGVVSGSILMGIWGGARRRVNGIIGAKILLGLSCILIGIRANALFPALGLFGTGFAVAVINAHWLSVIQNKVGMELQGRVVSINLMLVMAMVPLGFITASPLADGVFKPIVNGKWSSLVQVLVGTGPGRGIGLLFVLAGLLIVVLAIAAYRYRPIRYLEDDLPDVFADPVIEQNKDLLQYRADQLLHERQKKH